MLGQVEIYDIETRYGQRPRQRIHSGSIHLILRSESVLLRQCQSYLTALEFLFCMELLNQSVHQIKKGRQMWQRYGYESMTSQIWIEVS